MADSDLSVRFTGDTSSLNKSIADARSSMTSFGPSTSSAKTSLDQLSAAFANQSKTVQSSTAGWRENLQAAANAALVYVGLRAVLTDGVKAAVAFDGAMQGIGRSLSQAQEKVALFVGDLEIGAVQKAGASVEGAAQSFWDYADAAAHGAGAARSFISDQTGIVAAMARVVLQARTTIETLRLYTTDVARTELTGIAANGNVQAFVDAIGGYDKVKSTLVEFTAELKKIPGITDEAAASIQTMLTSIPSYSSQANLDLIKLLATISATGDEAKTNATTLISALSDTSAAGGNNVAGMVGKLVDNLQQSTGDAEAFKRQLGDINTLSKFFSQTLQPASASAYYSNLIEKLQTQFTAQKAISDANAAALAKEGYLGQIISFTRQRQVAMEKEQNAERQKAIDLMTQQKGIADQITAAQGRKATFDTALEKANPINSQIEEIGGKISVLQGQLDRSSGKTTALSAEDITNLVRTVIGEAGGESPQGQLAVAAVALNRLANGNFGDTLTAVVKAGDGAQFNAWKPNDPTGAQKLSTESDQFQRTLHEIVLPLLNKQVESPVGGALNFLNPKTAEDKTWMQGMTDQKQIGRHLFGTAKNSPEPIEAMDDDKTERTTQALQKLQDELRRLNALKEGGSATDKASLDIAQQEAADIKDQLAAAKQLLAARQQDAERASTGTPDARRQADQAVAEAQKKVGSLEVAETQAAVKLEAKAYEEGSAERTAIENRALADRLVGLRQGSAEYNTILGEMVDNAKKAVDKEKADAAAAEAEKYSDTVQKLKQTQQAVQEQMQEGTITRQQGYAKLREILQQEAQAQRDNDTVVMGIYGEGTEQYRKALRDREKINEQSNTKIAADLVKQNEEIYQNYKSQFEKIGNTVASSLTSIIEKSGTWQQLLQNVAKGIISDFVSMGVKMEADWLAVQAKRLVESIQTEAGITAATTTGIAARNTAEAAGATAGASIKEASVLKSITSSVAETFAGVFGFLSPVLGPAAAVPAAAAAGTVGTVRGLVGFDQGAWSLPHDMVANVHAGEMIVPRESTPWAQSLMANAAGRTAMSGGGESGGGGGHTFNINHTSYGSRSPDAIKAESQVMIKAIMNDMVTNRDRWQKGLNKVV